MSEIEKRIVRMNIPKPFLAEIYYNNNEEESNYEFLSLTAVIHKLIFFRSNS
jgi:hypothetical protein